MGIVCRLQGGENKMDGYNTLYLRHTLFQWLPFVFKAQCMHKKTIDFSLQR